MAISRDMTFDESHPSSSTFSMEEIFFLNPTLLSLPNPIVELLMLL